MAYRPSVVLHALVSLLAAPEVASAGTVGVQDGRLAFTAGGGEANAVRLAPAEGAVIISDAVALSPGAGCTAVDATTARCDATGLQAAAVELGDGADSVSATELALPVSADGGPGDDTLDGGDGTDTVDSSARDDGVCVSLSDFELCGGHDEVDRVGSDVERIVFGDGPDVIWSGRWEQPIEVHGGGGDDSLTVAGGHHRVHGGPGDDKITVSGWVYDWADDVWCGDGADTVFAYYNDLVYDDCEEAIYPTFIGDEIPAWWTDRARREALWYVLDDPQNLIAHEVPPERRTTLPDGRTVEMSSRRGGGAVAMTCSSACTMSARLIVSRAASRRLGLARRVLARAAVERPVAKATRKLRFTGKARRALRRRGAVNAILEVRTVDAAGKARVDVQRVRVSRSGRLTSRRPG